MRARLFAVVAGVFHAAVLVAGCGGQSFHRLAGAPKLKSIPQGDTYFDCDAASGVNASWSQAIGPTGDASGSVFIAGVRSAPESWANVGLVGADPWQRALVSLEVNGDETALLPIVRYSLPVARGESIMKVQLRPIPLTGMTFELHWEPNLVRFRTERGAPWIDIPVAFAPTRFELLCDSAETIFYSVRVDR